MKRNNILPASALPLAALWTFSAAVTLSFTLTPYTFSDGLFIGVVSLAFGVSSLFLSVFRNA